MAVKDIAVKKRPWLLLPDGAKKSGVTASHEDRRDHSHIVPRRSLIVTISLDTTVWADRHSRGQPC